MEEPFINYYLICILYTKHKQSHFQEPGFHVFGRRHVDEPRQQIPDHILRRHVGQGCQRVGGEFSDLRIPVGDFGVDEMIEESFGVLGKLGDEACQVDERVGPVSHGHVIS